MRARTLTGRGLEEQAALFVDVRVSARLPAWRCEWRIRVVRPALPTALVVGLDGADLSRVELNGSDFSRASLRGAKLSSASLQGANFWRADLEGAIIREANLFSALLGCASLVGTDRRFPLSSSRLR